MRSQCGSAVVTAKHAQCVLDPPYRDGCDLATYRRLRNPAGWPFAFSLRITFTGFSRILKWFAIPFSRGPRFLRTLHDDPSVLGILTRHGS